MKVAAIYAFFFVALLCSFSSMAQQAILSGKVTDGKNKPLVDAVVRISKNMDVVDVFTGEDGMYYSPLLPVGSYHVDIISNGVTARAKKVYLSPQGREKKYYNFKVVNGHVAADIDYRNPYVAPKAREVYGN